MEGLLQLVKSLGLSGLMLGGTGIGDVGEFSDASLYYYFSSFCYLPFCAVASVILPVGDETLQNFAGCCIRDN